MSERHEAGQDWQEFLDHLDSEHFGSRNPAFIPADEPLPENHEFIDDDDDEDEACRVCGAPAEDHDFLHNEAEWGWEATPAGVVYLAAMELGEAKVRLDLVPLILDRILEQVKKDTSQADTSLHAEGGGGERTVRPTHVGVERTPADPTKTEPLMVSMDMVVAECSTCGTKIASSDATIAIDLRTHIAEAHEGGPA